MSDLNQIAELIKVGDKAQARQLLLNALRQDRGSEQAWLFLAACATNRTEFEQSLLQVLKINPLNAQAIELLQKNKITLPKEVKAALKRQKRAKKAIKGGRRSSRTLLLLVLVVLIIAGGFFLLSKQQKEDTQAAVNTTPTTKTPITIQTMVFTPKPTEKPTKVVTAAATPTQTPTPAPPTPEITALVTEVASTATSTIAPPRLPTGIPTATKVIEPTATPFTATLSMVYNEQVIYIQNVSAVNQDISELVFVQKLENGEEIRFETKDWYQGGGRNPGTIFAMQPNYCFQLGVDVRSGSAKPQECTVMLGWVNRASDQWFWLPADGGSQTFLILQGDEQIAECQIADPVCEFVLKTP